MVKLNNKKINFLVKAVARDKATTKQLSQLYGVSQRRIQQLAKKYQDSNTVPKLNWNRRPRVALTEEEKRTIDVVWEETRRSSRLLWFELRRRGYKIAKNKIHSYLRETGRTIPNPRKQKKRKRCRYERKHSGSLIHGDWHRKSIEHPYLIAWEDDASRKILAAGEFSAISTDNSIEALKLAEQHCAEYLLKIRQANTDRGSEFFSSKENEGRFEKYLKSRGNGHVVSRVNNPQTNGKLERFWYEYDKHRFRFKTLEEFVSWYNQLIHGELDPHNFLTPEEAFVRRMPEEVLVGMFGRLIRW